MTKKKNIYIKPQLCKEFGVTEKTLNYLCEMELINPDWQYRHGLLVVDLSEKDRRVLSCSKNCLYNSHGKRLPFQRFLWLRFMQMPLELVKFELESKNLLWCAKLGNKFLENRYEDFLKGVPGEILGCVKKFRPPKTKEEKEVFDVFLDVCELRLAYENPEWDEAFKFMNDGHVKTVIDALLSTTGTYSGISSACSELLGVPISPEALAFYQLLFHDMELLAAEDIKDYYQGIPPSRRKELQLAHGNSLEVYKLQSGLQVNIRAEEIVDIALHQVSQRVLELTSDPSAADSSEVYQALRNFNILVDRHTKIIDIVGDSSRSDMPSFFKGLTMAGNTLDYAKISVEDPNTDVTDVVLENEI